MLNIPGEVLLCPPSRRIVLPGQSTRDVVRDTAARLVAYQAAGLVALWLIYRLAAAPV